MVNLSVFPQRTFTKFGAAGVCILAGFVVKYIQSIYTPQTRNSFYAFAVSVFDASREKEFEHGLFL